MRLLRVEIERFRQIKNQRLDWHPVTVLFGPNDAGKSSVLAAIEAIFRSVAADHASDASFAAGAIAVEFDPSTEEPDELVLGHIQGSGSVWCHPKLRAGDGEFARWFNPSIASSDSWYDEILPDLMSSGDEELAVRSLIRQLSEECTDAAVLEDAEALLAAAVSSRVFRFDTNNSWQWSADPHRLSPSAASTLERLLPRLDELNAHVWPPSGREVWSGGPLAALKELNGAVWALQAGGHYERWCSWDSKPQAAVLGLWRVVRIGDPDTGRREAETALAEAIDQLIASGGRGVHPTHGPDGWLEERDGGWTRMSETARSWAQTAADLANELAPKFVTRDYEITTDVRSQTLWVPGDLGSRLSIGLQLHGGRREPLRLTEVGSALGVWASYAVVEAARRILATSEEVVARNRRELSPIQQFEDTFGIGYYEGIESETRPDLGVTYGEWLERAEMFPLVSPTSVHTIYLFDEPERHLHPVAQSEARAWIAELVSRGDCSAVVATHSPEFLDLPVESAQYVRISRNVDREADLVPITDDVLGALRREADLLGLHPTQLIHLTRIWLVVEGEHDSMIVRHFYRRELERARVTVFPLRGAKNALAVGQLEHLASFRAPIRAIFDDPIASGVLAPAIKPRRSFEQKMIDAMSRILEQQESDFEIESVPFPDILCVLSEDAVRATLQDEFKARSTEFAGWDSIISEYDCAVASVAKGGNKPDFKQFALQSIGAPNVDSTDFVRAVLSHSERLPEGSPLDATMRRFLPATAFRA